MKTQSKEPLFNSNELNKILPSYLLDEIDKEEKKDCNPKNDIQFNNFITKDSKKERKKFFLLYIILIIFL